MNRIMDSGLLYGAAYYPELWPETEIPRDIELMLELGINTVRMGEFAWAKMEPEPNQVSLDFFVRVMDRLHESGIATVFCTPTVTPPRWLSFGHPERCALRPDGIRMDHGARQHICVNDPYFRERSRMIITAIAEAVGDHPGLIAWQTDNEFLSHFEYCICDVCADNWHHWLAERYATIDQLNESWGTELWSQRYGSFDEVPAPVATPFAGNSHSTALSTCYRLFSQDMNVVFQDEQLAILRKYSDAPVTHNSNVRHHVDHEKLFRNLDFAAFDAYDDCDHPEGMLMNYDLWRNWKPGIPFWLMETSAYQNGCHLGYRRMHREGYLLVEALAAYAFGAAHFGFWLWRQQRTGVECPHGAILSSWGSPTVGFNEVKQLGGEIRRLAPYILETRPKSADVAIIYSDRARNYFKSEPLEAPNYIDLMKSWYKIMMDSGIHRDLIPESADLSPYKVLMTPFLPYITEALFLRAKAFVEAGGTWLVGPLSGMRTADHTLHTDAALGRALEDLAGVETVFAYSPTLAGENGTAFGQEAPLTMWSHFFRPISAVSLGNTAVSRSAGLSFLTERVVGLGRVLMLGSLPGAENGAELLASLFRHCVARYKLADSPELSPGTVVAPRVDRAGDRLWFIFNIDGDGGWVRLPVAGVDLLTNERLPAGELPILPYTWRIISPESGFGLRRSKPGHT